MVTFLTVEDSLQLAAGSFNHVSGYKLLEAISKPFDDSFWPFLQKVLSEAKCQKIVTV